MPQTATQPSQPAPTIIKAPNILDAINRLGEASTQQETHNLLKDILRVLSTHAGAVAIDALKQDWPHLVQDGVATVGDLIETVVDDVKK